MNEAEDMKDSILEDLYMIRQETFRDSINKKYEKFLKKLDEIETKLYEDIDKSLKKENVKNEALNALDDLLSEIISIQNFWNEIYYKEGIADAVCYKKYLLNELCIDTFENNVLNETKQKFRGKELNDKLTNIINKNVSKEDVKKMILLEIDKLIKDSIKQKKFWRVKCYKKGYYDIQQLIKEAKQYKF